MTTMPPSSGTIDDIVARLDDAVTTYVSRRFRYTGDELTEVLFRAYIRVADQTQSDVSAMRVIACGFVDAVRRAGESEPDAPLDVGAVVGLAHRAYLYGALVPAGPPPERSTRAWRLVDEDFPELRARALHDAQEHGLASRCLGLLWDGPEVRELYDRLRESASTLDERFALCARSREVLAGFADDRDFLVLLREALRDNRFNIATGCFSYLGQGDIADEHLAAVQSIADDRFSESRSDDPAGRRLVASIILAGVYDDSPTVRRLLALADRIEPAQRQDDGLGLRPGLFLGRAAAAAHLAGDAEQAVRLARMQEVEESGTAAWSSAGEAILADYIRGLNESDNEERVRLFGRAADAARHGQVFPLFSLVNYAAAQAALDAGPAVVPDDVVRRYIGVGRYLERVAGPDPEGHFWDPYPIAGVARHFPAGPWRWEELERRLDKRAP